MLPTGTEAEVGRVPATRHGAAGAWSSGNLACPKHEALAGRGGAGGAKGWGQLMPPPVPGTRQGGTGEHMLMQTQGVSKAPGTRSTS